MLKNASAQKVGVDSNLGTKEIVFDPSHIAECVYWYTEIKLTFKRINWLQKIRGPLDQSKIHGSLARKLLVFSPMNLGNFF